MFCFHGLLGQESQWHVDQLRGLDAFFSLYVLTFNRRESIFTFKCVRLNESTSPT